MGLFDIFFKKKEELTPQAKFESIPTVDADPRAFSQYAKTFFEVMADVDGFAPEEFDEMLDFIQNCKGGYMNMGHYYKHVFDNYFSGRPWAWAEYDYWEKTYAKMGRAPIRFPKGLAIPLDRAIELTAGTLFSELRVAELREFIEQQGVDVPQKAKRIDLLELARSLPNLESTKLWKQKEEQLNAELGYPLYAVLMRYIAAKTNAAFTKDRSSSRGKEKFKLVYVEKGDEEFVKLALKRNPQALPPYFPDDVTLLRPIIRGFS